MSDVNHSLWIEKAPHLLQTFTFSLSYAACATLVSLLPGLFSRLHLGLFPYISIFRTTQHENDTEPHDTSLSALFFLALILAYSLRFHDRHVVDFNSTGLARRTGFPDIPTPYTFGWLLAGPASDSLICVLFYLPAGTAQPLSFHVSLSYPLVKFSPLTFPRASLLNLIASPMTQGTHTSPSQEA